jgi:hypothetical protein
MRRREDDEEKSRLLRIAWEKGQGQRCAALKWNLLQKTEMSILERRQNARPVKVEQILARRCGLILQWISPNSEK